MTPFAVARPTVPLALANVVAAGWHRRNTKTTKRFKALRSFAISYDAGAACTHCGYADARTTARPSWCERRSLTRRAGPRRERTSFTCHVCNSCKLELIPYK